MKKLIINPTKEERKGLKMINVNTLIVELVEKIFRTTYDDFKPVVTTDAHTKTFISMVDYKRVAIQDYSGKQLNDIEEALVFYNEVGKKVYDANWPVELLKNEVRMSKDHSFGVRIEDNELVKYIEKRLHETDDMQVIAHEAKTTQAKNNTETKKEAQND